MIKKNVLLLLCLISCRCLRAQELPDLSHYKTVEQKLQFLGRQCDTLRDEERYDAVIKVARYALQIMPVKDWDNLSRFSLHLTLLDNVDTAIYYAERAVQYGKRSGHSERTADALGRLLNIYTHHTGNEDRKRQVAAEMQAMLDTAGNDKLKAYLYHPLATYYGSIGTYEKQVNYLLDDVTIAKRKQLENKRPPAECTAIGVALLNIAEIYIRLEQAGKGLPYLLESRAYFGKYQNGMSHYYKSMTDAYVILKQPGTAAIYYDSLTRLCEAGFSDGWGNRIALDLGFAEYFLGEKNNDKALKHVLQAENLIGKWPDDFLTPQIDYMMGRVYAARGEYDKALPYLKASEQLCRETGLDVYASLLQTLAQCHAGLGQWQQAYIYYEKYAPLRDSLYNNASGQSLADAEAKYQNKEKQQQIAIKNTQLIYAGKQKMWLIEGLGLASLIVLLLGIIYRSKRRTARALNEKNLKLAQLNSDLEEANQTKAKLFGIISHDLRSPISQVYQFLKLQQTNPALLNDEQKAQLNNKIQTATGSLLETMEDLLLWSKTQMNQFTTEMQAVEINNVIAECLQLLQLNSEAKGLVIENNTAAGTVVDSDPYFLQAILRNLLQNAIKASPENGVVKIDFKDRRLSVINQGSYFSQQQYLQVLASDSIGKSLSGLGLRIVNELSEKINVQVYFTDTNDDSTCVQLTFS